ncbi:MAG: homocysteine S-methyltransferase family protein [Clostridia bacterium]|nr:homocysteine S-methyltransferase family protein [Clostridia bacterium]
MSILTDLQKGFLFFDGGMGTELQKKGILAGECPENWNISNPKAVTEIHKRYFEAGANIATANTFGANPLKLDNVDEIVFSAINNAKKAITKEGQYVALDIGPTGKLLKPLGDLDFEDAIKAFSQTVIAGTKAGADLILIETMSDPYELKAAIIASKENSSLPIFATFVLDNTGKTITGADVGAMVALLEGLGVSALGVNCSLGAEQLKAFVPNLVKLSSLPIIVNPNAGLPCVRNGKTHYDQSPESFANDMLDIAKMGARILGGCCGTTAEHISKMTSLVSDITPKKITKKNLTVASSYSHACYFDKKAILIGERINPTGKPKLKDALRRNDIDYLIREAIGQEEKGADLLDVNVGLPEIDEKSVLVKVITEIQAITTLPLQIDTSSIDALEAGMRIYNGKPLVNSVNGKKECMKKIFPIVKKYGGVLIALTLDENGIPETAEGRLEIARKIIEEAEKCGIDKKDIIVDPLCLTVSSDKNAPSVTLESIKLIKSELGVKTSLGISNVSFGLPQREIVNSIFFAHALQNGLDAVILNPFSEAMQRVYYAHNALMGIDDNCQDYINFATTNIQVEKTNEEATVTLEKAIIKGLKKEAHEIAESLVQSKKTLEIVNEYIIPALDKVGLDYEKGKIFLPQLLMSADTATVAFDVVKKTINGENKAENGEVILATVKGDIHDIGKNIVKVILENYGFTVYDLGKDVSKEAILDCVNQTKAKLVGLSALMTTTVPSMEEVIKLLRKETPEVKIMVGGAVLTEEYARMIGADKYSKDAMESVRYAQEIYKKIAK